LTSAWLAGGCAPPAGAEQIVGMIGEPPVVARLTALAITPAR